MTGRLSIEIKQTKPFQSIEEEAYLNILRTADALMRSQERLLKLSDLSFPLYNLLRILRGAGQEGLPCMELGQRMITYSPDLTRLVDKLEARELVARARQDKDRRVVRTRVTAKGLEILRLLDNPVKDLLHHQLQAVGRDQLVQLISLLETIRSSSE